MRRRAPLALGVLLALGACTVAGPRPGARDGGAARLPERGGAPAVRVGVVVDAPSVRVDTDGRFELVEESGRVRARTNGAWTVTREGRRVVARSPAGAIRVRGGLIARPVRGRVRVDGTAYRGAVLLRPGITGVTAVNLVDLEAYLRGVVPLEIGAGRPAGELAAVRAQAIAARTYAVRQLGRRDAQGFDYYGSVLDQAYGGADAEDPAATRAVEETRGMVLVHDGRPIEAYYHSTCGGRTAALDEVWPGEPRPYLRSVSDRTPDGGAYCEASNRFRWSETWDERALLAALSTGLGSRGSNGAVTRVESVAIDGRTASGRAAELVVRTNLGERRVAGDSIRRVLQPEPGRLLNSTAIALSTRGDGRVVELTVEGAGWGHGIGMCQVGALGRARAGHSYRDILSTYYPGTELVRLYR